MYTQRLTGKSAVVLGAATSGNMGQALVRRFVQEGASVLAAGRDEAALAALSDETGCSIARCDIASQADLKDLVAQAIAANGRIDIGVNACATNVYKPFLETTGEDLERITAINFIGLFQFVQELVKAMPQGGSIIQISSAVATIMLDWHAAYMGTKAGMDHALRAVANEFGEQGIRINTIAPGLTDTPMASAVFTNPNVVETYRREYPLGRLGTAEDIAEAAVFLASDGCFMTGQTLQVNGGLTLRRNPRLWEIQQAMEAR